MNKHNNNQKRGGSSMPRYFNNQNKNKVELGLGTGLTAGGGGGGLDRGSGVGTKKKKFPKPKKQNDGEEAIDIEDEIGEVDSEEISAFVSKLGLNKFTPEVLAAAAASQKKGTKNKKQIVGGADKPKVDRVKPFTKLGLGSKTENGPSNSNHLRFEEKNGNDGDPADNDSKEQSKKSKKKKKNQNKTGVGPGQQTVGTKMFAKPGGNKWYEEESSPEGKLEPDSRNDIPPPQQLLRPDEIAQIQKTAVGLLEADVQAYKAANTTGSNKSDYQWMEKMMKTGTLPDKLAAFTVRIQDSPVHNLHFLQQLISMVKVQGKQQCMMTADTLRELFLEDLLPPERKLVPFTSRRGSELKMATKKQLIKWAFEDKLKVVYASYVDAVKRMASDTVEKLRGKGIVTIYQLLVGHPEHEEILLQGLVNKLGDPAKKLASRALFYLKQLLEEHPRMKRVVVEEVERLLFRNNISKRAQYYGICFLNLVDLRDEHASLANKLITVYIAFFKACVKTGDIDTKMMSGLLTGINRAFPQAREFGFQFSENLDTLYKIVQFSQFTISIQALCILFQIVDVPGNPSGADRFYRVLYEKLNSPEFKTSSHNAQLLNLIFKALKADTIGNRVSGFTKRLLQICQNCAANLACAILFLLSEIAKVHPKCIRLGSSSEQELTTKRESEETFNSSESDDDDQKQAKVEETVALKKLMKSTNIQINDAKTVTKKQPARQQPEVIKENAPVDVIQVENDDEKPIPEDVKPDIRRILTQYDPNARNPCYSGAELSLAYELMSLSHHFHPSVALFAQTLAKRKAIKYDGNPFRDFTLTRFLERFSYRNAKPAKKRPEYQPKGLRNVPVNSDNYLAMEEEKIPIEEKFFYRFFKTKKEKVKSEDKGDEDEETSDVESIGDDEFDSLMSNYFKSTTPGADDDSEDEDVEEPIVKDAETLDFASGLSAVKAKGKKRKQDDDSEESEDEEDEDFERDDGDEFISMDDDGDFGGGESGDEDDDDMGIFEDDDDEMPSFVNKRKLKKSMNGDDMFAPAEQFAEMLEENADQVMTGSQTLINRDRSDKKQLKWEMDRDRWAKGPKKSFKKKFKRN